MAAFLVTFLTGLVENTLSQGLGATWYGFPAGWLYRLVLGPEYYPWRMDALGLILDVLFWALIFAGVFLLAVRIRERIRIGRQA
jgi:hypothetical protein